MLSHATFQREIARLLLALDASPGQPEPSKERLTQLYEDVQHLDDASFSLACDRCRKELDWFPKAKHIIERALAIQRATGATLTGETAWAQLWRDVISQYSEANNRVISARIKAGGPGYPWPDDACKDIVRHHLGLPLGVYDLATMTNDFEREKYRKLFIKLYDERAGTAQAVAQAEVAAGPSVRLLPEAGD